MTSYWSSTNYLECASSIEVVGYGAALEASFGAISEHIPSRNSADSLERMERISSIILFMHHHHSSASEASGL